MDIKPGDEVFVCLKWNETLASRWDTAVVEKTTQASIYIDYPPLLNKRIPKETMASSGYIVSKETMASHGYIVFVPTDSDRIKRDDAIFRRGLISTLIKADWGNLKTETLVKLVTRLKSDEQTPEGEHMRTPTEIQDKIKKENQKFLGFQSGVLIDYLTFDQAKQFFNGESKLPAEEWKQTPLTTEAITAEMREYMSFAIDKATDHRGLSAGRSIDKMKAWLWLLGDQDLLDFADSDGEYKDVDSYKNYGAPTLLKICQKYKLELPMGADFLRMAEGLPCRNGCDEGCSH